MKTEVTIEDLRAAVAELNKYRAPVTTINNELYYYIEGGIMEMDRDEIRQAVAAVKDGREAERMIMQDAVATIEYLLTSEYEEPNFVKEDEQDAYFPTHEDPLGQVHVKEKYLDGEAACVMLIRAVALQYEDELMLHKAMAEMILDRPKDVDRLRRVEILLHTSLSQARVHYKQAKKVKP